MRPLIIALAASLAAAAVQPDVRTSAVRNDGKDASVRTTAVQSPLILSRTRLSPTDHDRNFVYLHSRTGPLASTYVLKPTAGGPSISVVRTTLAAVDLPWDSDKHGCLQLPPATPPGTYTLDAGRGPEATITVVAAPVRKVAFIAAGLEATKINQLILAGFNDLVFAPGYYTLDRTITLPAGCRVRGYGAVVFRLQQNPIGDKCPCFQIGGADVSIYGFQFIDVPGGATLFSNPQSSGLVLADLTLKRCNLGFYHSQAFIRDCTFNRGWAIICPGGLWLRNAFVGPSPNDAMQAWYGGAGWSWQFIDTVFDGTARGPVFQALNNSIESPFFCGTVCRNICGNNNDGEIVLCEAGALNRLLYLHGAVRICDSEAFRFDGGGADNFVRHFSMRGGIGVVLNPSPGATISNFTLQDAELEGAGIYVGVGVTNPTFPGCRLTNFCPTRGGQSFENMSPLCGSRTAAILLADQSNIGAVSGIPVVGLAANFTAVGVLPVVAKKVAQPAMPKSRWPKEWGQIPTMKP